jgi:hypothetical protein
MPVSPERTFVNEAKVDFISRPPDRKMLGADAAKLSPIKQVERGPEISLSRPSESFNRVHSADPVLSQRTNGPMATRRFAARWVGLLVMTKMGGGDLRVQLEAMRVFGGACAPGRSQSMLCSRFGRPNFESRIDLSG